MMIIQKKYINLNQILKKVKILKVMKQGNIAEKYVIY